MSNITKEQLSELMELRIRTLVKEGKNFTNDPILKWYETLAERMNRMVKCDHCGNKVHIDKAHPCVWAEYNAKWYYCNNCHESLSDKQSK